MRNFFMTMIGSARATGKGPPHPASLLPQAARPARDTQTVFLASGGMKLPLNVPGARFTETFRLLIVGWSVAERGGPIQNRRRGTE
jgi:hypothetical protein